MSNRRLRVIGNPTRGSGTSLRRCTLAHGFRKPIAHAHRRMSGKFASADRLTMDRPAISLLEFAAIE
jgi:hypothetical protein